MTIMERVVPINRQGGAAMQKQEWEVTIKWKDGTQSCYVYEGKKEDARRDAYLSSPQGDIRNVIVKPYRLD